MEGFERKIDIELFSGLFGGSELFYGLFPTKLSTDDLEQVFIFSNVY